MTNLNSSANNNNNFDSIDAEFGINNTTTNNTTEVKTMTNQSEINNSDTTNFNLEAGCTHPSGSGASSINTSASIPSPADQLADNDLAVAPYWEVITNEERSLVDAANEISGLEVHKNTFLNFSIKTVNSASFRKDCNIKLIEFRKAEVNRSQLEAEYAKYSMKYQSLNIVDGVAVFGTTKPNGFSVECAVDFNKGYFAYQAKTTRTDEAGTTTVVNYARSKAPLAIRKFAVVAFNSGNATATGLYHAEQTFALFANLLNYCWTVNQFKGMMSKLQAKLVIDGLAQSEINGTKPVYGRRRNAAVGNTEMLETVSIQSVIEAHKIGLIPVVFGVADKIQYNLDASNPKMSGDEILIADKVFGGLVHTDKNAKKYLVYGAGSLASGLGILPNGDLVSASLITDATKGANRLASESFHHAINQSATWNGDNGEGGYYGSGLVFPIGNGKFARPEGINIATTFAFSAFNLNNGIIETNAAKDLAISFDVPKSLTNTVTLSEFITAELLAEITVAVEAALVNVNPSLYQSTTELVVGNIVTAKITEAIEAADSIITPAGIKLGTTVVISNSKDFSMELDKSSLEVKTLSLTGELKDTQFTVKVKTTAHMVGKRSVKLRGNTKKGTSYPTNTTIADSKTGASLDWVTLLTPETVKASKGLLELIANHPEVRSLLNVDETSDLVWNNGVLTIGTHEFTHEGLMALVESLCTRVNITHQVSQDELNANPQVRKAFETGTMFSVGKTTHPAGSGLVSITEHNVLAFNSYASYQVELSCADENSGAATLGVNEQIALSSFHQSLPTKLAKLSKQTTKRAAFMNANFVQAATVVQATDKEAVAKIADMLSDTNPKQGIRNLSMAYPDGVKFVVGSGRTCFEAWCPFSALLEFTPWNGSFPASTTIPSDNEYDEVTSKSLVVTVIELINKLQAMNESPLPYGDDVYRDIFRDMSGVRGFLKSLRNKTKDLLKVGAKTSMYKARTSKKVRKTVIAHHQKVVGDLTIGRRDGLPVVRIHPSNPMDIHVGDVVAISRCPLPMFTICKVELDDTLDTTVVAVNPIVWVQSNLGDFDGDTIYVTELKRLVDKGESLTKLGLAYNAKYSALATHWEIHEGNTSPLVEDIVDTAKVEAKFIELCTFNVSVDRGVRADNLVAVNRHYSFGVGRFFDVASALSESLGNKALTCELSDDEVKASHKAWIQYEEAGLGGFSTDNRIALETVKEQINTEMVSPGTFKPRTIRGRVVANKSINFLAIEAAAIRGIGAKVLKDPKAIVSVEAMTSQAFKRLSKSDVPEYENALWFALSQKVSAESLGDTHRFGEQMVALGKVRAVFEEATVSLSSWE